VEVGPQGVRLSAQQRIVKLAGANAALRAALRRMADVRDVDGLVRHTFDAISEQLGARSGTAWLLEPVGRDRVIWTIEDGRAMRGADSTLTDILGLSEGGAGLVAQGAISLVNIPLLIEDAPVGAFTFRLDSRAHPAPEDLEIAHALAEQAAFVLRLMRSAIE